MAIDQIEAALNGDDSGPLDVPPAITKAAAAAAADGDDDADNGDDEPFTQSMIDVSMSTTLNETANVTADDDNDDELVDGADDDDDADAVESGANDDVAESDSETVAEKPKHRKSFVPPRLAGANSANSAKKTEVEKKVLPKGGNPVAVTVSPNKTDNTSTPAAVTSAGGGDTDPELTSRSGRKIKPKRYLHEEIDELAAGSPTKRKSSEVAAATTAAIGARTLKQFKVCSEWTLDRQPLTQHFSVHLISNFVLLVFAAECCHHR